MTDKKSNEPKGKSSISDLSKVEINKELFKKVGTYPDSISENTTYQIDGQTSIFYSSPRYSLKLKGFTLPSHLELVDPMQGAADILELALFNHLGYDKHLKGLSITELMEEYLNDNWDVVEAANFEAEGLVKTHQEKR